MSDLTTDTVSGPPEIRAELELLLDAHGGRISPQLIVEAAANPASAMHDAFMWDDTEAAHRYRLQQAGALLRRFQIVRQTAGRTIAVPAYLRVPDQVNGYARTGDVLGSDWVIQQRRLRLIGSMERLRDELANWDEFVGIVNVLDEALAAAR
jgi:hypothetical protein